MKKNLVSLINKYIIIGLFFEAFMSINEPYDKIKLKRRGQILFKSTK